MGNSNSRIRSRVLGRFIVFLLVLASICLLFMSMSVWVISSTIQPWITSQRGSLDNNLIYTVPNLAHHLRRNSVIGSESESDDGGGGDHHVHVRPVASTTGSNASEGFHANNGFKNQTIKRKIWTQSDKRQILERGLAAARAVIRRAGSSRNILIARNDTDYVPNGVVYRNPEAFYQSYIEMEKRFKVYVYKEGELPISHDGPCKNIYAIEGRFIDEMENGAKRFRTIDGEQAHVYFMPFSVTWMVKYLYKPNSHDQNPLRRYVADYVNLISARYPFWNRTNGADHFMVACHDWGPHASEGNPFVYNTSIRVLCNANSSESFNPQKDVSLPEIHLLTGEIPPELHSPPENATRSHLAFFAGGLHGTIRPILLQHWKGRDDDMQVHEYLPNGVGDYHSFMLKSKFCLCPSGYEVASPRVVEAIYAGCVPVILSDSYVLPFSDVLKWDEFSINVEISDIPKLKEILSSVSEEKYQRLKEGLKTVRRHFVLNQPAERFDVFHMLLHSIWLRRLNVGLA
ncbi:probable glycosyltransferase At5g25310 [Humulus lupulus]|uniref:probable glycosyltransferase At5g25310 n=1 Tax=Humulus lupulus TaxID=3486 RepID=UPI002B40C9A4|nr:probable glycosyltransferase At5g25310 [Humulus lupulus]